MHGVQSQIPTRYPGVIALIDEYHWSYEQIDNTPSDLVEELLTRIQATRKWTNERDKRDKAKNANANKGKNKGSRR
jgi:hypothetical protein